MHYHQNTIISIFNSIYYLTLTRGKSRHVYIYWILTWASNRSWLNLALSLKFKYSSFGQWLINSVIQEMKGADVERFLNATKCLLLHSDLGMTHGNPINVATQDL